MPVYRFKIRANNLQEALHELISQVVALIEEGECHLEYDIEEFHYA